MSHILGHILKTLLDHIINPANPLHSSPPWLSVAYMSKPLVQSYDYSIVLQIFSDHLLTYVQVAKLVLRKTTEIRKLFPGCVKGARYQFNRMLLVRGSRLHKTT